LSKPSIHGSFLTGRTESRLLTAKEELETRYGIRVLPIVADGAYRLAILPIQRTI